MSASDKVSGGFPSEHRRLFTLAISFILLLAVYLHLKEFLFTRSLWLDEAKLALNILSRGYFDLLFPLADDQAAPIGYLWLTKLSTQLFGPGEKALRFPALLASLVVLPWVFLASRRFIGARGALFSLLIVAICPMLIEYASEVKQYQFDVLASVAVLHASAFYLQEKTHRWAARSLAVAGCFTLLFSHAVVFVTFGAGLVLLAHSMRSPREPGIRGLFIAGACVFSAGVINYLLFLQPILANEDLVTAHASSFPEITTESSSDPLATAQILIDIFHEPLGLYIAPIGALAFLMGLFWLAKMRSLAYVVMITAPLMLLCYAVMTDRYSFYSKYLLFTVPLLAIGVSAGIEGFFLTRKRWRFITGCLLAFTILGQTTWERLTDGGTWRPREKEELRPVLEYLEAHIGKDDLIFIYGPSSPFDYYTEWAGFRGVFSEHPRLGDWDLLEEFREMNPPFRMWIILSHIRLPDRGLLDYRLDRLRKEGRQLDVFTSTNSATWLFEVP